MSGAGPGNDGSGGCGFEKAESATPGTTRAGSPNDPNTPHPDTSGSPDWKRWLSILLRVPTGASCFGLFVGRLDRLTTKPAVAVVMSLGEGPSSAWGSADEARG